MANFLLVGDAPNTHSGLARIAKDIAQHIVRDGHPVDFLGLGWEWGWTPETDPGYPVWPIRDGAEFGERDVLEHVYRLATAYGLARVPLIVWFIWDSSRCASPIAALRAHQKRGFFEHVQIWGYYAVDAEGPERGGGFAGPAAMAVQETDRPLAYTEFGTRILQASDTKQRTIPNLPHGLSFPFVPFTFDGAPIENTKTWGSAFKDKALMSWAQQHNGRILGSVATNQPRKDLPLLLEAGARARESGLIDALWLHTDLLFGNYMLPIIAESFGWIGGQNMIITTPRGIVDKKTGFGSRWTLSTDEELAAMYQACRVTFAPGLGEGFGYPIVESIALGIPCVGVNYAGGAELIPETWRAEPSAWRWDGGYCLKRPVIHPGSVFAALKAAIEYVENPSPGTESTRDYARSLGQKWAWSRIWPELWRPGIEEGLK